MLQLIAIIRSKEFNKHMLLLQQLDKNKHKTNDNSAPYDSINDRGMIKYINHHYHLMSLVNDLS